FRQVRLSGVLLRLAEKWLGRTIFQRRRLVSVTEVRFRRETVHMAFRQVFYCALEIGRHE
ncbi:MAG TPA: hypothetical protein VJS37_16705, partial [Terriglobales bacterium]|nr:hypothetical protein [Terriglobales bacterium]